MTITFITGANKGLGRETARRLIELGHTVLVGARDPQRGAEAAAALGARALRDVRAVATGRRALGYRIRRRPGVIARHQRMVGGELPARPYSSRGHVGSRAHPGRRARQTEATRFDRA